MPQASGGWVNLSDYMSANAGAGQEMSAAGSAEVEKRRVEASRAAANVNRQSRQSAKGGGSTDPSQQAGYADYAKAQAGVQDAAHLSAGGSGNMWDAAIAAPTWNADKQAQGAYSALQSQLAGGQRSAEMGAHKGEDWNKAPPPPPPRPTSTVVQGNEADPSGVNSALYAAGGGAAGGAQDSGTHGHGYAGNQGASPWEQFLGFFQGK